MAGMASFHHAMKDFNEQVRMKLHTASKAFRLAQH
jgi:hypothetical protein